MQGFSHVSQEQLASAFLSSSSNTTPNTAAASRNLPSINHATPVSSLLPTPTPQRTFKLTSPLDLKILVPLLNENTDGANEATMERLLQTLTSNQRSEGKTSSEKRIAEDVLPAGSASDELVQINVTVEELQEYLMCLTTVVQNLKQERQQKQKQRKSKSEDG